MSYTSLYSVYKTKVACLCALKNAWGSAPALWDYIALKCTGKKFQWFVDNKEFWKLWKDVRVVGQEKAVLLSTYDLAFVETEYLDQYAKACFSIHEAIINETDWTWTHFRDIGSQASRLNKNHDHRCLGLGIGCTSVSDPWRNYSGNKDLAWPVYEAISELKGN